MAPSSVTRYHIFVNIINPITLAGLLETQQSILEAEKPGGVVHGLLSRTKYRKQNVTCHNLPVVYPWGIFPTRGAKKDNDNVFWALKTVYIKEYFLCVK